MTGLAVAVAAALSDAVRAGQLTEIILAFSGGRDSTVLLDLLHAYCRQQALDLRIVHVDHRLHSESAVWAAHCRNAAAALGYECEVAVLDSEPAAGDSVEAWAREHRYHALGARMSPTSCLVTAHHADDQAATVLQRVLGGAGPFGLRGMARLRRFGAGWLARPLLECSATAVANHADLRHLRWLDDPGNVDRRFLRNRLHHDVLPLLEQAQPGAIAGLLRLASVQASLADDIDERVNRRLTESMNPPYRLALSCVREVPQAERYYLLRGAILRAGLALPRGKQLMELLRLVSSPAATRGFSIDWPGAMVRRYRDDIYFVHAEYLVAPVAVQPWDGCSVVELPAGRLSVNAVDGRGISRTRLRGGRVTIGYRHGGERCRLAGRRHSHSLKKLLQDWGIPPWERDLVPLIYIDGELAAVGNYAICAGFASATDGVALKWQPRFYGVPNDGE